MSGDERPYCLHQGNTTSTPKSVADIFASTKRVERMQEVCLQRQTTRATFIKSHLLKWSCPSTQFVLESFDWTCTAIHHCNGPLIFIRTLPLFQLMSPPTNDRGLKHSLHIDSHIQKGSLRLCMLAAYQGCPLLMAEIWPSAPAPGLTMPGLLLTSYTGL